MFNLPSDDDLDIELDAHPDRDLSAETMLKDSSWGYKFSQALDVDSADVHGV